MPDPNAKRDASLSDIARALKDIPKVLATINENLVAGVKLLAEEPTPGIPTPPYTMRHLPYLDQLHDDMGLTGWWQRSELRQIVQNTPDLG